jgi:hypothetical protein
MDGWMLRLGEVGHVPLQLVLDGLVDLDVLASQWPSVRESHWRFFPFIGV